MANGAHHSDPRFIEARRILKRAAAADPLAVCWRCGRTLTDHADHKSGAPVQWHAGHTVPGVIGPPWVHVTRRPPPGKALIALEASTCNITAGNAARATNADTGFNWP